MSTSTRRDLLVVCAAASAGVHAALAPAHLRESIAEGSGFIAATALLTLLIVALTVRPGNRFVPAAAVLLFGGLLASYAAAATSGIPLLHPAPEPVDGLAGATKVVEFFGLALAAGLTRRRVAGALPLPALALALLIAVFSAQLALALSGGHHHT